MLIILSLVVTIFSSSCAPHPVVAKIPANKISEKVGLPFGTVITIGGKKMTVISQENEEVRLKPFVKASVVGVRAEAPRGEVKPEWESKTVITEGVKNVQECLNPSGCPQDTKTGECLEGCAEVQKVRIEMTETIIDPEKITEDIWRLCYTPKEISEAIQFYANLDENETKRHEYIGNKICADYFEPVTRESVRLFLNLPTLEV